MKPPQAFYDFTLQFHQDLDLVYPDWASDFPQSIRDLYAGFRRRYGDQAVIDLAAYFSRLLNDKDIDLESLWFNESKADWIISEEGLRRLFEDFEAWALSVR